MSIQMQFSMGDIGTVQSDGEKGACYAATANTVWSVHKMQIQVTLGATRFRGISYLSHFA